MTIQAFRKVKVKDNDLRQVQDAVSFVFQDLKQREIIDGIMIENIVVNTTGTVVQHTLGRPLRGYLVVKKNANVTIWDSTADTTELLKLISSGTATVSLWVF